MVSRLLPHLWEVISPQVCKQCVVCMSSEGNGQNQDFCNIGVSRSNRSYSLAVMVTASRPIERICITKIFTIGLLYYLTQTVKHVILTRDSEKYKQITAHNHPHTRAAFRNCEITRTLHEWAQPVHIRDGQNQPRGLNSQGQHCLLFIALRHHGNHWANIVSGDLYGVSVGKCLHNRKNKLGR